MLKLLTAVELHFSWKPSIRTKVLKALRGFLQIPLHEANDILLGHSKLSFETLEATQIEDLLGLCLRNAVLNESRLVLHFDDESTVEICLSAESSEDCIAQLKTQYGLGSKQEVALSDTLLVQMERVQKEIQNRLKRIEKSSDEGKTR